MTKLPTPQSVITAITGEFADRLEADYPITSKPVEPFQFLETALIEAFGWHPIERVDEFGLREIRDDHKWGPRIIVMVKKSIAIAYWDPDIMQADPYGILKPVASPSPYWRILYMTRGWSRGNPPSHFLRPTRPDFSR